MAELSRGWATDLAILRHTGSRIDDRGDHLVIRSPHTPLFHWGNFVIVTDPATVDDADRWLAVFAQEFPHATHIALGLARLPATTSGYAAHGVEVTTDQVLTTDRLPEQRALPAGYVARPFRDAGDWEQQIKVGVAENARTGEFEPAAHLTFLRDQVRTRTDLVNRGVAQWFGAFAGDTLVADLGIVVGDGLARYQAVVTDAAHRQRGLAGHLLGLAARWSAERGASAWVIVTETTNPAGRLYRSVGFEPDAVQVAAYRRPPLD